MLSQIKVLILVLIIALVAGTATASMGGGGNGLIAEHLKQAQFTTRISNRMPVDNLTAISTEFKKVFFFTDIRDCKNCDIKHEWWYKGNLVSTVESEAKYPRYRWWTNKTLNGQYLGDWTVKVIVDGDQVYTKTIRHYKPTRVQQQNAPIQKRIMKQGIDECEMQLQRFSDKVQSNPDDAYYKFMLKKWGKRCN